MKKFFKLTAGIVGGLTVICGSTVAIVSCSTNGQKTISSNSSNTSTTTGNSSHQTTTGNSSNKSTTTGSSKSTTTGNGSSNSSKTTGSSSHQSTTTGNGSSNSSKTTGSSSHQSTTTGNRSSKSTTTGNSSNGSQTTSTTNHKTTVVKPTVKLYQIPANLTNGYDKSINNGNYVEANGFNQIKNTVVPVLNEMKTELMTMKTDSDTVNNGQDGMPVDNPFIFNHQNKIVQYIDNGQSVIYQYDVTMATAIQSIDDILSTFNTNIQFSSSVWPKYYENVTSAILQTFGTWLQNTSPYSFSVAVGLIGTTDKSYSTMDQLAANIQNFIQQNPNSPYQKIDSSCNSFLKNANFLNNYDNQIFNNSAGYSYDNPPPIYKTTSDLSMAQWLSFIQIVNQQS